MPKTVKLYNANWPGTASELDVEIACVRAGGMWKNKAGETCGRGLFFHYKRIQSLLWPLEDHHRWSDLILENILANTITICSGPKDSGKTRGMTKFGLTDYFCFPDETLIIVSSTDIRSLEGRVWGDIKGMFSSAKELWPDLPGVVIDNKHAICTDDLEDENVLVRDMRRGILCFLEGSMVDTPSGPVAIEKIKVGDEVINACGVGTVKKTMHRLSERLVRVKISDDRILECTPEHPVFTQRGWINAIDLSTFDRVYCAHETLHIMREGIGAGIPQSEILHKRVPSVYVRGKQVRTLRCVISALSKTCQGVWKVLQRCLRGKVGGGERDKANTSSGLQALWKKVPGPFQSKVLHVGMPKTSDGKGLQRMREEIRFDTYGDNEGQNEFLQQILQAELEQPSQFLQAVFDNEGGKAGFKHFPGIKNPLETIHRNKDVEKEGSFLRVGHCVSENKTGRGDRWGDSQNSSQDGFGFKENEDSKFARVDSVEVLQSSCDKRYPRRDGGYPVHNLEIGGHPSYSVNGVIVHNCVPCKTSSGGQTNIAAYVGMKQKRRRYLADEFQFMSMAMYESLANMNSGDFKMVAAGNPIGQDDPLDKISEPKCGWDAHPEPTKTTVWENKMFLDSKTVCLVGTDSPNFDLPPESATKYWYMVNRDSIARTVAGYGRDSSQYYSQCVGVRKVGLTARRVITKALCEQHGAFGDVTWLGLKENTKIFALDAAYGGSGGDRCVGGHIEFGLNGDNRTILFVHPPVIVPVSVRAADTPENQIAVWSREYCEQFGIPPQNAFYDSTGRGTLGLGYARKWSDKVNPVEFGGSPSNRPVTLDIYVTDMREGSRRLKLCHEHYSKFVTELWYSVRYAVESGQIRGLPRNVAEEGFMREWRETKGNKIEVESKVDMKVRTGKSPDLFDWLATALEGARQLGFSISKLGGASAGGRQINEWDKKLKEVNKVYEDDADPELRMETMTP